jgi:hypothetical protein
LSFPSSLRTRCSTISMAGCSTLCSSGGTIHARSINSRRTPCLRMMPPRSNKICLLLRRKESPLFSSVRCSPPPLSFASSFSSDLSILGSACLRAQLFQPGPPSVLW